MTNEDEDTSNRPILTLDGESKPESGNLKDRPTLPDKEEEKNESAPTEAKVSVNSKTNPEAGSKAEYDFNAIYDELHAKFPNIINMGKPVLLAIAIRGEMLKEVNAPNAVLHKWIGWYFRKSNYYSMHELGAIRYNLDGSEAGAVTKKDQAKRDKQMNKIKAVNPKDKSSKLIEGEKQKNKTPASESDNKEAKSC